MKKIILLIILFTSLKLAAQDLQPTNTEALLKVLVVGDESNALEGEEVTFISLKDGKTYTGTTDAAGRFSVLIPNGQKYKVKYTVFSTEQDFKPLDIPAMDGPVSLDYTITVRPPKVFTLNNVFFDTGKYSLNSKSFEELNKLAEYMTRKKSTVIEIAGHTDNSGTAELNQKLSEKRANTVRDYLLRNGVAPERVIAKGYGDTEPVADNATPEGKQKNRRTEVRIITQ